MQMISIILPEPETDLQFFLKSDTRKQWATWRWNSEHLTLLKQ